MPLCPKCHFKWESTLRSNQQNRYMHGVVFEMIAEEMGEYDVEHVKDLMKRKFLTITTRTTTKRGIEIEEEKIRHTSELDTFEMKVFLERCKHWARDFLKINIPDPTNESLEVIK